MGELTNPENIAFFLGSGITVCCSLVILSTYISFRILRRQPNNMVFSRSAFDFALALLFLYVPFRRQWADENLDDDERETYCEEDGKSESVLVEFLLIGSEMWYFCLSYDLFMNMRSPFRDFQGPNVRYRIFVFGSAAAFSALLAAWPANGRFLLDLCWTTYEPEPFNLRAWMFYFVPLFFVYAAGVYCVFDAWAQVKGSQLPAALAHRTVVLTHALYCLLIYTCYWVLVCIVYVAINIEGTAEAGEGTVTTAVLAFVLSARGSADALVWFMINDWSAVWGWFKRRREVRQTHSPDFNQLNPVVDEDINALPQSNEALREELLLSIKKGIRHLTLKSSKTRVPDSGTLPGYNVYHDYHHEDENAPRLTVKSYLQQWRTVVDNRSSTGSGYRLSDMSSLHPLSERLLASLSEATPPMPSSRQPIHRKSMAQAGLRQHDDDPVMPSLLNPNASAARATAGDHSHPHDVAEHDNHDRLGSRMTPGAEGFLSSSRGVSDKESTDATQRNVDTSEKSKKKQSRFRCRSVMKDYAPIVFSRLRHLFGVSEEEFVSSFDETTRIKLTEGRSGSFMFFTLDGEYVVKTLSRAECRFLRSIIDDYYAYMVGSVHTTLLTRFYACYSIKMYNEVMYFVVMKNFFPVSGVERYDLKGSWVNRNSEAKHPGQVATCANCQQPFIVGREGNRRQRARERARERKNRLGSHRTPTDAVSPLLVSAGDPSAVSSDTCSYPGQRRHVQAILLKDDDLQKTIPVDWRRKMDLSETLKRDTDWLVKHNIMDYSFLLGIHRQRYMIKSAVPVIRVHGRGARPEALSLSRSLSVASDIPSSVLAASPPVVSPRHTPQQTTVPPLHAPPSLTLMEHSPHQSPTSSPPPPSHDEEVHNSSSTPPLVGGPRCNDCSTLAPASAGGVGNSEDVSAASNPGTGPSVSFQVDKTVETVTHVDRLMLKVRDEEGSLQSSGRSSFASAASSSLSLTPSIAEQEALLPAPCVPTSQDDVPRKHVVTFEAAPDAAAAGVAAQQPVSPPRSGGAGASARASIDSPPRIHARHARTTLQEGGASADKHPPLASGAGACTSGSVRAGGDNAGSMIPSPPESSALSSPRSSVSSATRQPSRMSSFTSRPPPVSVNLSGAGPRRGLSPSSLEAAHIPARSRARSWTPHLSNEPIHFHVPPSVSYSRSRREGSLGTLSASNVPGLACLPTSDHDAREAREGSVGGHASSDDAASASTSVQRNQQPMVVEGPACYYYGVVDILQQWNWRKRLEYAAKTFLCQDTSGISAVNPEYYARRFHGFVTEVVFEGVASHVDLRLVDGSSRLLDVSDITLDFQSFRDAVIDADPFLSFDSEFDLVTPDDLYLSDATFPSFKDTFWTSEASEHPVVFVRLAVSGITPPSLSNPAEPSATTRDRVADIPRRGRPRNSAAPVPRHPPFRGGGGIVASESVSPAARRSMSGRGREGNAEDATGVLFRLGDGETSGPAGVNATSTTTSTVAGQRSPHRRVRSPDLMRFDDSH
eukprot:Rmarinus@m.5880